METATSLARDVTKGAGERRKYRMKEQKRVRNRRRKKEITRTYEGGGKEGQRGPCSQNSCAWCPAEVLVALVTHHCTISADTWSIVEFFLLGYLQTGSSGDQWKEETNALI